MQTNNKLREALTRVKKIAASYINCHDDEIDRVMTEIVATCDSALAEPVKNYEVGTVEEQNKRLCSNYFSIRRSDHSFTRTALEWAQMPYTEGGAK